MENNDDIKKKVLTSPLFTILNEAFQVEVKKIRDDIAEGTCRLRRKERKDAGASNPNNIRVPVNKKDLSSTAPVTSNVPDKETPPVLEKQAPVETPIVPPPEKIKEKSAVGKLLEDVGLGGLGIDI